MTSPAASSLVQYVPTRLGDLAVTIVGSGPTAVLWHSMFVDSLSWARVVPELSTRRRLLLVDGPAHGSSPRLRRVSSIEECAEAALELIDGLHVDEPVDWVGNAWGGHVGMHVAAGSPERVRSLVAISSPTQPIANPRTIAILATLLRLVGPVPFLRDKIADAQLTDASRRDAATLAVLENALSRTERASLAMAIRSFIVQRRDAGHLIPSITSPALFLASDDRGEWSPEDAARTAAAAPDARSVVIEGARTLLALEQPAAVAREVLSFWEDVANRP